MCAEERLIRYIVKQVASGRHVDDILADPYVMAHTDDDAPGAASSQHPA